MSEDAVTGASAPSRRADVNPWWTMSKRCEARRHATEDDGRLRETEAQDSCCKERKATTGRGVEMALADGRKGKLQGLSYNFGRVPEQVWRKLNEQKVR